MQYEIVSFPRSMIKFYLRILDLHISMQRIYILFLKKCLIYFLMNEKMTFLMKKFNSDFFMQKRKKIMMLLIKRLKYDVYYERLWICMKNIQIQNL